MIRRIKYYDLPTNHRRTVPDDKPGPLLFVLMSAFISFGAIIWVLALIGAATVWGWWL